MPSSLIHDRHAVGMLDLLVHASALTLTAPPVLVHRHDDRHLKFRVAPVLRLLQQSHIDPGRQHRHLNHHQVVATRAHGAAPVVPRPDVVPDHVCTLLAHDQEQTTSV